MGETKTASTCSHKHAADHSPTARASSQPLAVSLGSTSSAGSSVSMHTFVAVVALAVHTGANKTHLYMHTGANGFEVRQFPGESVFELCDIVVALQPT